MRARTYSERERAAFRVVDVRAWNRSGSPDRGPAQFATGPYWPKELRRRAAIMRSEASAFEVAAAALEREMDRRDDEGRSGARDGGMA